MSELVATSVGTPAAATYVGIGDGRVESLAIGKAADLMLARWAARQLHSERRCTPELAEAGHATGWQVVSLDDRLREARAAVACMIVAEHRMNEVRRLEDVAALVRASAAWLSTLPTPRDQIVTLDVRQVVAGPLSYTVESAAIAFLTRDPNTTCINVFPTRDAQAEYIRLLDLPQTDAAYMMDKLWIYHRRAPAEYVDELRDVFGTEYAPIVSIQRNGNRDPVPAPAFAPAVALVHAVAKLGSDDRANATLVLGDRTFVTTLEVSSRTEF
jgi:hypothetical protein